MKDLQRHQGTQNGAAVHAAGSAEGSQADDRRLTCAIASSGGDRDPGCWMVWLPLRGDFFFLLGYGRPLGAEPGFTLGEG